MTKTMKTTAALLVGAFLLAGTLPASAQQASGTGTGSGSGRQLGPGDGTELKPAPKDGTGFGSSNRGIPSLSGTRGSGTGSRFGGTPQGTQGSTSQGSASRRGRG